MKTRIALFQFATFLFLLTSSCAKSNTRLGIERDARGDPADSEIEDSGPGLSSDRSESLHANDATDSELADVRTDAEEVGLTDTRTDSQIAFDSDTDGTTIPPLEDAKQRQERLDLISQYCNLLVTYPCLTSDYDLYDTDSIEQRVQNCELASELIYANVVDRGCDTAWEEVLKCALQSDYSCPCSEDACTLAGWTQTPFLSPSSFCQNEMVIYAECTNRPPSQRTDYNITGERTHCTGHLSLDRSDPEPCRAVCPYDDGNPFGIDCRGPLEGPFDCHCTLNGYDLSDAIDLLNGIISGFLVSDCENAVQELADGRCHEIVNCCFTLVRDDGSKQCRCTADPTRSTTGETTCSELPTAHGGEVVDLCPLYIYGPPGPHGA